MDAEEGFVKEFIKKVKKDPWLYFILGELALAWIFTGILVYIIITK